MADADLQAEATAAMSMLFEMFKRDNQVTFYKHEKVVVASTNASHNADYDHPYLDNIAYTPQSESFDARIIYPRELELNKYIEETDTKLKLPRAIARIQVKSAAYEYLKDAEIIYIDEIKYTIHQDFRPLGMLGTFEYWEVVLIRDN